LGELIRGIELLAPAKDLECGLAAIDCGADAVYIGASRFGAREAAANDMAEIRNLVEYAHRYWARVYAAVNTLLRDDELPAAVELIYRLHEIEVDGVIIQDVGLLETDLPPIPLIASTQMHNDTPEKVAFLEKVGIRRVILARELDIDQIRDIRAKTRVELEVFVHGALCVCYSGQCALSYALGGRSGNRGECAQPCRKTYEVRDLDGRTVPGGRHPLSIKDLNLADHYRELLDAGVCSFKIEGRLKDRGYVANTVAFHRRKLDEVMREKGLARSSSGVSAVGFEPDPSKTFNRDFTTYFLHGPDEQVGRIETPKMTGERLGVAVHVSKRDFTLDSDALLRPGDGVCWFDRSGSLRGSVVNGVSGPVVAPRQTDGLARGCVVYRNYDRDFAERLGCGLCERKIGVRFAMGERGESLILKAIDEDGCAAESVVSRPRERADKPDVVLAATRRQIEKTGGTEFACDGANIELHSVPFIRASLANSLRREVLRSLAEIRLVRRPRAAGGTVRNDEPYPERELTFLGNVLNSRAEEFYRRHGVVKIEPAAERGLNPIGRKVMTTRYCLRRQLELCPGAAAGPLTLISEEGDELELRFDCSRCLTDVYLRSKGRRRGAPGG